MLLTIEEVEEGAAYEGTVYDNWMIGTLPDGQRIRVFNQWPEFELEKYKKKSVDLLLLAFMVRLSESKENARELTLTCTATEGFEILESDWKINQPAYSAQPWLKFQTEQGYMIIHPSEIEEIGPDKLGESIHITAARFDLIGLNQETL